MDAVIFNTNDLTVLSAGLFALIIAIVLAMQSRRENNLRNRILAAFFLQTTLTSIAILGYWNVNLNAWLSSISANFFFTLGFAPLLQGPLLYWCTRSVIHREFHLQRRDLWHLVPALAYPFYMAAIYFRFDEAYKLQFVHSWARVNDNPYFLGLIWTQTLAFAAYNLACLQELRRFILRCRKNGMDGESNIVWLKVVIAGFLALNSWQLAIRVMAHTSLLRWGYAMGTLENYFKAFMLAGLLAYLMRNTIGFPAVSMEDEPAQPVAPAPPAPPEPAETQDVHLKKLHELMQSEKPYLQPNINLERLALRLDMSPKLLSGIINKKLNQNFFEMIRNYRIDEARNRLSDEQYKQQSINEIMQECGFNSKSVFNQWFKERFGTTPSQFRKRQLGYADQDC